MRIAIVLAGVLLAAGCRAPLEGAPCPCLDGYDCNVQNVCVLNTGVPDGSPQDDAGGGGADSGLGVPDGSLDGGHDAGAFPDGGATPDAAGGEPDASGGPDASVAVWYEQ